jgi:hypothetical protein
MKTRSQKIRMIRAIMKGESSLSDIPQPITGFYLLHNGIYTDMKTGFEFTQLNKEKKQHGPEHKK